MIKTEFNHQTGVLITKFEGDVTLKEIVDYIVATKKNKSYPRVLKILTDATKSNMLLIPQDLEIIVEENYKSIAEYDYIIDAIVLDSPKDTALSILYQQLAKTKKYKFQIFSTQEAAIHWLESINPKKVSQKTE